MASWFHSPKMYYRCWHSCGCPRHHLDHQGWTRKVSELNTIGRIRIGGTAVVAFDGAIDTFVFGIRGVDAIVGAIWHMSECIRLWSIHETVQVQFLRYGQPGQAKNTNNPEKRS